MFVTGGWVSDGNKLYTRPPMPLALALILYLGVVVALVRFKRAEYALLLIWFVWMWLPSVLSDDAPNIRRMIGSTPPMAILIALGMGWLFDAVKERTRNFNGWRSIAPAAVGIALGGLLIYTTVWSYQYFFVDWGRAKNLYHIFDVGLVDIGKFAAATPPDTRLYYTPADDSTVIHLPVVWQVRDRKLQTFDGRHGLVLAPRGPDASLYLITAFMGDAWTLPALQKFYPTGRVAREAHNPYGELHSLVFAVGPDTGPAIRPQAPLAADFQGQIQLLGSDLSALEIRAGETLTLTLYWQPETAVPMRDYTVFAHLLGPVNPASGTPVWAGHDGPPLGNSYPTSRWQQGEVIVDRHELVLPAEIPAGTYPIEVGLYDPQAAGTRLNVLDAAGETTERQSHHWRDHGPLVIRSPHPGTMRRPVRNRTWVAGWARASPFGSQKLWIGQRIWGMLDRSAQLVSSGSGKSAGWSLRPAGLRLAHRGLAIRACHPIQLQRFAARRAGAPQFRGADRADQPVRLGDGLALGAGPARRDVAQQRLFFQLSVVNLGQGVLGPQEQVEQQTDKSQDQYQQASQDPRKDIARTRSDVAQSPDDQCDPEGHGQGGDPGHEHLQDHTDFVQQFRRKLHCRSYLIRVPAGGRSGKKLARDRADERARGS